MKKNAFFLSLLIAVLFRSLCNGQVGIINTYKVLPASISGMTNDSLGNIYYADHNNNVVRKINTTGIITVIAGTGSAGYSGDGGPATDAQLNDPMDIVISPSGSIYITDNYNHAVRKISTSGTITTIAGTDIDGDSGDGGPATSAKLDYPLGITIDRIGNIYIAQNGGAPAIRKIDTSGIISTFAGTGGTGYGGDGGPANLALLHAPWGITSDSHGNIYVADGLNDRIRKIDSLGIITTIAGNGITGYSGDGGSATSAKIYQPLFMKTDVVGNLYFSDADNAVVRKVSADGIISTVAGSNTVGYWGDGGLATLAALGSPSGIAIDFDQNLYIADDHYSVIRKVSFVPSTDVLAINDTTDLAIYPNPATDNLTIKTKQGVLKTLTITNTFGQVFLRQPLTSTQTTMNIKSLPPGLYYVTFYGTSGSSVQKFIKQ